MKRSLLLGFLFCLACVLPAYAGEPTRVRAPEVHLWILGGSHCPACMRMKGELADMQAEGKVTYIDTNLPKFRYLIQRHRVRLLPHSVLGIGGKYHGKRTGYMKPKEIKEWFQSAVANRPRVKRQPQGTLK